ncbi:MAG: agmK, partial [Myxococcaceae bacterium]|nr:agmK [Myxococcaceae bacterium]
EAELERSPQFGAGLKLLETLLVASKRWKTLAECTQRQLQRLERVPGSATLRSALWRMLAELRARKLKDDAGAIEAYSAGARLALDDAGAQEALADFAIHHPEHAPEAIAAYVRAIPHSADPARICGVLAQVAEQRKDRDSMILAAGAAALVGTPSPETLRMLRESGQVARGPVQLRMPVSDALWQSLLLHPSLRGSLGQLMALIYSQAGAKYAADLGDFKLHPKKHRIELGDSKELALNNLRYIARTLGFEGLNLYSPFLSSRISGRAERHPDEAVGLRVNPTAPLSLFLGEPLLREPDLQQLTAHLGATLALLRPELAMAVMLPPEGLAPVLEAALTFADPNYPPRVDPKLLKAEQKRLGKALSPEGKTALTRLASNLLRTHARTDLTATFFDGVRHTTSRAALLVAGDFAAVQARALPMQSARAQYFVRELVVFAVGGDLHALRVETGSQLTAR